MRSWEVQLQDGTKVTMNNRLDCIVDTCPRPQLKLKKSIKGMESEEIVEVLINNPPWKRFPHYARKSEQPTLIA